MFKYRKAFLRNDGTRYQVFLEQVRSGEAKLHTGTLYPYELVAPILSGTVSEAERLTLDTTWNALPDYASDGDALVVVDGSGSMYWNGVQPMPATLYFISDMEFDSCAEHANLTNFEYARRAFEAKGYKLPRVVFWNVASRALQQPVTMNEQGVALVSGCTPLQHQHPREGCDY